MDLIVGVSTSYIFWLKVLVVCTNCIYLFYVVVLYTSYLLVVCTSCEYWLYVLVM